MTATCEECRHSILRRGYIGFRRFCCRYKTYRTTVCIDFLRREK